MTIQSQFSRAPDLLSKTHGVSIGIHRFDDKFFMQVKVVGKLSHKDYDIITPMIDNAVAGIKQPNINALIDCTELEGWELRAAWDDFKMGLKHNRAFEKIAVVGNKPWEKVISNIGGWFISGETQYFECFDAAVDWLNAD